MYSVRTAYSVHAWYFCYCSSIGKKGRERNAEKSHMICRNVVKQCREWEIISLHSIKLHEFPGNFFF